VNTLAVQPDGGIIVGGHFETVDTETQFHQLVRLFGNGAIGVEELRGPTVLAVLQEPSTGVVFLQPPGDLSGDALLQLHGLNGELVHQERVRASGALIPLAADVRPGLYLVSLTQGTRRLAAKVVLP
jgi:hypothetical protein